MADFDDIERYAGNANDNHLECRNDGHTWRPYDATVDKRLKIFERWRRCTNCQAEQYQMISMTTGEKLKSSIQYGETEDYLLPTGTGRLNTTARALIRLEYVSRIVDNTAPTSSRKKKK